MQAMGRVAAVLPLVGAVGAEALVVAGLVQAGAQPWLAVDLVDLGAWLALTPPEQALVALARLVALAAAGWLLVATCLYAGAVLVDAPAAARAVRWALPAPLRAAAERAAAVALTAQVALAGAVGPAAVHAAPPPPAVAAAAAARGAGGAPAPVPPPDAPPVPPPDAPGAALLHHVVAPGEHLWGIAEAVAAAADPAVATAPYWAQVVSAAAPQLRSGDPDLVHPGERLALPAPGPVAEPPGLEPPGLLPPGLLPPGLEPPGMLPPGLLPPPEGGAAGADHG